MATCVFAPAFVVPVGQGTPKAGPEDPRTNALPLAKAVFETRIRLVV